jgi:cytoskeletal protein RodZ
MSKFMTGAAVAAILTIGATAHAATATKAAPTAKPAPTTSTPPTDTAPPATTATTPDPATTPPPATTDQTPTAPSTPSAAPAAPTGTATDTAAVVAVGMPVKDNTGAQIGQVTAISKDAAGKDMATIQMGTDSFSADTTRLGVAGGAVTINLTQQQIADMLHKPAAPK